MSVSFLLDILVWIFKFTQHKQYVIEHNIMCILGYLSEFQLHDIIFQDEQLMSQEV